MTNDSNSEKKPVSDEERRAIYKEEDYQFWGSLLLVFLAVPFSWFVLTFPNSLADIRSITAPETREPWGTVISIRFVGGFLPTTQVTTDDRTFLLEGVANVPKAAVLERRKSFWSRQICVKDTQICWDLVGQWPVAP